MCKGHCPATVATQWKPPQPIATTSGPETDAGNHTTTYHYDAQRYTKEYAYDGADTPISVKDANSHTAQHRYDARWGLGTATYNDSTTTVYAYDGPRNPTDVDVKDPAGSVVRFTGKERDSWGENNQLDYFGARYFSSTQGRWTTPDWSPTPEAIPYADPADPQTLNLYAYAHNNPLSYKDDDGHCTVDGEEHGFWWCAAHAVGFTQTKKEAKAAKAEYEKSKKEFEEWARQMQASGKPIITLGVIPIGMGAAAEAAAFEEYKDLLRAQMERPYVLNPELNGLLDDLYREGATVGSGSTAAAVREELKTGLPVGGRTHLLKAQGYVKALEKWLARNATAAPGDRAAAENVIKDMKNALSGKR